jgi:asparagine synthase (glutamine-hydrolysing)
MFRYIGFVWDAWNPSQVERAGILFRKLQSAESDFATAIDRPGIKVMFAGAQPASYRPHMLTGESGVVLGLLFHRHPSPEDDSSARAPSFGYAETQNIMLSNGRRLISHYWGDYVAVLVDPKSNFIRVVKDPTGNLPCLHTEWQGISIVFSSIADCLALQMLQFTVNWSYVASRIATASIDCEQRALKEVSQVYRGECLEICPGRSGTGVKQMYWNPSHFTQPSLTIRDVPFAARALRAAVRSATHTLAAGHRQVLLRLSGGLDSSIIAACLYDAPAAPAVTAFTYSVLDGKSDERRWARLAANRFHFEHIEKAYSMSEIRLDGLLNARPSVEPGSGIAYLERGIHERQISRPRSCTAIFNGDGGDSSFGSGSIGLSVDDYLRLSGAKWGVISLAAQVALCRDTLVWKVLAGAFRRRYFGTSMREYRQSLLKRSTLTPKKHYDAALRGAGFPHPWFRDANPIPWGTIWRLGNLMRTPQFYDPFRDPAESGPASIAPLYSQPVVELALQIPSYVHFHEGHDRGLARQAFRADIPDEIRNRRWKDRAPGTLEELTFHNRDFICETLLDGNLAKAGVIDRKAVEEVLRGNLSKREFFVGELYAYLDLEIWSRHFVGHRAQHIAA